VPRLPSPQSSHLTSHLSQHTEWREVINSPHLSSYHLLVPSLHSSGPNTALGIHPFTLPRVAKLLAHLVRTVANGGTAHIVGVSLGAHIGIALASLYPSVCTQANRVVFVSGYNRFQAPRWLRPVLPYVCYGLIKGPNLLPEGLVKWAMDGADVTGAEGLGKQGREEVKEEDKEVNGTCTMECEFATV
jgi:pimeloyl-ACP methyl ester carboxylesterase